MQRKHWAIAVVAAAAMATVVTWQLRRHHTTEAPQATGTPPAGGHAFQHQHGGGAGGGGGGRETPVDEPELRRGPLRVQAADDPVGKARLSGKVVDGSGAPVAGVTVSLAAQPPRQATTDQDGGFAFEGLLPVAYMMTACAPAGVGGPREVYAAEGATAPLALQLRAGGRLELEIVDEQQRQLDGATVELRGLDVRTLTAAQGRITVAPVLPGRYWIAAWAEGYGRVFQPLEVGAGSTSLRVELGRGSPVGGRVTDAAGKPVAAARVRFEAAGDAIAGSDLVRDAVSTDADGKFTFAAMPVGSYRFVATNATLGSDASSLIRVDGSAAIENVSIVMTPGSAVRGKVVDAAGGAAAFARVRLGITIPGARLVVPPRQVRADAAGEFALDGLPRRQLTAVAMNERGASAAQVVDARAGDVAGVVLTLDEVAAIGGVVVDAAGRPVAGARVSAWPTAIDRGRGDGSASGKDGAGAAHAPGAPGAPGSPGAPGAAAPGAPVAAAAAETEGAGHEHGNHTGTGDLDLRKWQLVGFPQALTDDAGAFRITGLAPGGYRLRAVRGASLGAERGALAELTTVQAGESAVKLVLPAQGGLKGKVAFEDGTTPDHVTVAIGFAQHEFPRGDVRIEGLSPQTYQLVVRGPTFSPRVVDVKIEGGKVAELGTLVVKPVHAPAAAPR
jgi:protocatechuate 3,4-dioxygenase beta subunit